MERDSKAAEAPSLSNWAVVVGIAVGFFLWGLLTYFAVGVKWPPPWDYGAVKDVPGLSPYSTDAPKEYHQGKVEPQHVMGRNRAAGAPGREGK